MGIYTIVNLTLVCDGCGKEIGKINTATTDVPIYARATVTCTACLKSGVEHPSGSTDEYTLERVDEAIEVAGNRSK